MKILKLSASFGALQNAELTLADGLNVITAPNEAGKSTWAAFLTAMLYGVDSTERTTKNNLPAKAKYKPWSGAPMEGRMELEWNGKHITLERSGKGRAPMSEFRAYETQSGLPIEGMTGENCGQLLLGVGRSVFERSAFLAQNAVAVTADAELEKRLSSLVTAGEETVSVSDTQKTLRDWRNRCRHNRTGLLPQTLMELQEVEGKLAQIHRAHQESLTLTAKREELSARQTRLQTLLAALRAQEARRALEQKEAARETMEEAARRRAAAEKETAALPPRQTLLELEKQLSLLNDEQARVPERSETPPQAPECPPVFRGLTEEEIPRKAKRDAQEIMRLCAGKYFPVVWALAACLVALTAGIFMAVRENWMPLALCAVCAAAAAACALWMRGRNREREKKLDQAQQIMKEYGNRSQEELVPMAVAYCGELRLYAQKKEAFDARQSALEARERQLAERRARLLGQASMLTMEEETVEAATRAVGMALEKLDALERARSEENTARSRFEAISTALGEVKTPDAPTMDLTGYELRSVSNELLRLNTTLAELRSELDQSRGRVEALGDPAELEARREALSARAQRLSQRYDALELAISALENANAELQTRFSPRISALAGKLLGEMTDGRYDTVLLGSDMRAETRQTGELVTRQLLYLSGGTADQVYLAVRLAICELALGADVPIVLDDALVRFDDERLKAALRLLKKEAAERQILLFTCQGREAAALELLARENV